MLPTKENVRQVYKFVTIYRRVDDEMMLEEFFSATHLPLAEQLPGLLRTGLTRIKSKPGGESRFHMQYELYFADETSYLSAFLSEPGMQLLSVLQPWAAQKLITWFAGECWDEEFDEEE